MTVRIVGLALMAGLAGLVVAHPPRLRAAPFVINESGSVPRGLYRLSSDRPARGDLVVVTPPQDAQSYLAGLGARSGARLLKRVAATGGDAVCAHDERLTWPGGTVRRLARDRRGRPLAAWVGCRRLAADELLLVGDTPTSFDSRYFGPVPRSVVTGVYEEVWRW